MEKILSISLKLNYTPNTLGYYGLSAPLTLHSGTEEENPTYYCYDSIDVRSPLHVGESIKIKTLSSPEMLCSPLPRVRAWPRPRRTPGGAPRRARAHSAGAVEGAQTCWTVQC